MLDACTYNATVFVSKSVHSACTLMLCCEKICAATRFLTFVGIEYYYLVKTSTAKFTHEIVKRLKGTPTTIQVEVDLDRLVQVSIFTSIPNSSLNF